MGHDNTPVRVVLVLWALLAFELAGAAPVVPKPARIVSMNVCTDQLLMSLVDRRRIVSVSFLAADPATSAMAEEAKGLHLNRGLAEELIALEPDLVIAGTYTARATVAILRKLDYPVLDLPPASSVKGIQENLLDLGRATGDDAAASQLIEKMDRDIARFSHPVGPQAPLMVNYSLNGWTSGPGTLTADLAHAAGFEVAGDRLGFKGLRMVPLEELILLAPQVIDLGLSWNDPPALASESHRHPALLRLLEQTLETNIAESLWTCGTPRSVLVIGELSRVRQLLEAS